MLRGWIDADRERREHLESLGIKLGAYDEIEHEFTDCEVPVEAFAQLEPYWFDPYLWYLEEFDE